MIERLQPEQLALCLEGGREFFKEASLPGGFVPEVFLQTFGDLILSGRGIVLASFDETGHKTITGALAGVLAPSPFNGRLMAIELFWFVLPPYRGRSDGLRLFAAFEQWAVESKAEMISFIHLLSINAGTLEKLYHKRGYSPVEVNYIKLIKQA